MRKVSEHNKPDLSPAFAAMPLIGIYMRADYDKVGDRDGMASLMHSWLNVAETTNNETKKRCYLAGASCLHGFLTGRSYECTNNNMLQTLLGID